MLLPQGVPTPAAVEHAVSLWQHSTFDLAADAVAEPLTARFIAQLAGCATMFVGGNALHKFGDVKEPTEVGIKEGEIDIYRDSPLRYLGYANEVGEAFRPLVPVEVVYLTYVAAISYILADTVDKGRKGAAAAATVSSDVSPLMRAALGAADTFLWQMLASVVFPSFCINRLVALLLTLQVDAPAALQLEWIPTAIGLVAIPLLIVPLDVLAHWVLNGSFRRVTNDILDCDDEVECYVEGLDEEPSLTLSNKSKEQ